MNIFTLASIIIMILGIVIFGFGFFACWTNDITPYWGDVLIAIGMLFLFGSIVMLCISTDYDSIVE
jgi:hypothetical protein